MRAHLSAADLLDFVERFICRKLSGGARRYHSVDWKLKFRRDVNCQLNSANLLYLCLELVKVVIRVNEESRISTEKLVEKGSFFTFKENRYNDSLILRTSNGCRTGLTNYLSMRRSVAQFSAGGNERTVRFSDFAAVLYSVSRPPCGRILCEIQRAQFSLLYRPSQCFLT